MIRSRNTRHGHPQPRGRNLSAVQKVGAEETNGDEEVEQEDEEGRSNLRRAVALGEAGGNSERQHAGRHTRTAEHEELAATKAVNGEEGDEAGEELPCESTAGEDAGSFAVEAETLLEDDLRVVSMVLDGDFFSDFDLRWSR